MAFSPQQPLLQTEQPRGTDSSSRRGLWGAGEWEPSGGWWEKRIETWGSGKTTLNAVYTLLDEKGHPKIMIFWPLKDKVLSLHTLKQNRSPLADTVLVVRWLRASQLTRHLGGVLMGEHAAGGRWSGGMLGGAPLSGGRRSAAQDSVQTL